MRFANAYRPGTAGKPVSLTICNPHQTLAIQRNLRESGNAAATSMARLSSGYRVNAGADAPADLVMSEQLRGQIEGLKERLKGTRNAANMLDTEDGILASMHEILRGMKKLAMQAANEASANSEQAAALQAEMDAAIQSLARISKMPLPSIGMRMDITTRRFDVADRETKVSLEDALAEGKGSAEAFERWLQSARDGDGSLVFGEADPGAPENATRLPLDAVVIDGTTLGETFQKIGGKETPIEKLDLSGDPAAYQAFSLGDLMSGQAASLENDPVKAMKIIDAAVKSVSDARAYLGAQRAFGASAEESQIRTQLEHLTQAESTIRDTAMATEIVELTRNQIRQEMCVGLFSTVKDLNRQAILQLLR